MITPTHPTQTPRSRIAPLALAIFLLLFTLPVNAAKWALLIGIDEYAEKRDLSGCANDIDLISKILKRDFHFPENNVETLVNEQATNAGIIEAFETHLIHNDRIRPGDVILVHYAGHGSKVKDESGDEVDGMDESLVPHDSRAEGVYDITDDQINGLMQKLSEKTEHVVFIFDSCHSGTASRGGAVEREVEPDHRPQPKNPPYAMGAGTRGAGDDTADIRLAGAKWVLISGCLASEKSNEYTFNGERHGALTWFLHDALMAAGDGATYRSIFDNIKLKITRLFASQHPQIEGPGQDVALFGTKSIKRKRYVLVDRVEGDRVDLNAGRAQMLGEGSRLTVYPAGTGDLEQTTPLARIEVVDSEPFSAVARIVERLEDRPVTPDARAVLEKAMYATEPISVHVPPGLLHALPNLAAELDELPAFKVVDWEFQAALILDLEGDEVTLRSADLQALKPPISLGAAAPPDLDELFGQLRETAHWMTVRDLSNRAGGVKISFSVRRAGDPVGTPTPSEVKDGDKLKVRARNDEAVLPLYVYLLDVSSDGKIYRLYPTSGAQEALKPGMEIDLPETIKVFVGEGRDHVTDIFKLIATSREIDASVFPNDIRTRSADGDTPPETGDSLADFLARATRGGTRGSYAMAPTAWGTKEHVITVRKATP